MFYHMDIHIIFLLMNHLDLFFHRRLLNPNSSYLYLSYKQILQKKINKITKNIVKFMIKIFENNKELLSKNHLRPNWLVII